jgi:hypothetical protein
VAKRFCCVEEDLQEVRVVRYGAWHVAGRLQMVEIIEDVSPVDLFHVLPGAGRCEDREGASVGVKDSL